MKHEDAERRYAQIEGERDYYKRLSDSRAAERDAALEREAALAAHVERLDNTGTAFINADDIEDEDDRATVESNFNEALLATPAASLARRDALKQAEALEDMFSKFRARMPEPDKLCIIDAEIISEHANDLRQRAQALK